MCRGQKEAGSREQTGRVVKVVSQEPLSGSLPLRGAYFTAFLRRFGNAASSCPLCPFANCMKHGKGDRESLAASLT